MKNCVAMWGFGQYGKNLLNKLINTDISVRMIIDMKFSESYLKDGIWYCTITDWLAKYKQLRLKGVIVAVMSDVYYDEIKILLNENNIDEFKINSTFSFISAINFNNVKCVTNGYDIANISNAEVYLLKNPKTAIVKVKNNLISDYYYRGIVSSRLFDNIVLNENKEAIEIDSAVVLTKYWSDNYWHFTFECLDQIYLLEKMNFQGKYIVYESAFAQELMKLLGIESKRIIWISDILGGKRSI